MRLLAGLLFTMAACGSSSPHVSTIRTGGMFPARSADCTLELAPGAVAGQMMLTHDVVGMLSVDGADANEPPNSPRLLALIKPQACALGGELVTVGMSASYTYPGTLHGDDSRHMYMVLRKKSGPAPVQTF